MQIKKAVLITGSCGISRCSCIRAGAAVILACPNRSVRSAYCALSRSTAGADSCGRHVSRPDSRCRTLGGSASTYLTGQALADAIQADQLSWDPSVQALLPFPSALEMMASDMNWTTDMGNAFLAQQQDVMDAVQRDRRQARDFGYLHSSGQIVVGTGPYPSAIIPVDPAFIVIAVL